MVQFTEETIKQDIVIKKVTYKIATPFEEGHVCTANEAKALNQLLKENVRNNFSSRIKEGAEAPSQEEFDAYVAGYEFGIRSVSSSDPITKTMQKIAENLVIKSLEKAGVSKKALSKADFEAKVDALLSSPDYEPKIRAKAEKIVEAQADALSID